MERLLAQNRDLFNYKNRRCGRCKTNTVCNHLICLNVIASLISSHLGEIKLIWGSVRLFDFLIEIETFAKI